MKTREIRIVVEPSEWTADYAATIHIDQGLPPRRIYGWGRFNQDQRAYELAQMLDEVDHWPSIYGRDALALWPLP